MPRVFLSAGHGGSDPGAVANGLREKDGNLQTMLACRDVLKAHGIDVVCSRTTDADDSVIEEVNEANASGADLAVSFHENAGGGDGWESYSYGGDANGMRLAELAEKYVVAMGQNSRGCKDGSHLWFVRATNMTAVLFETFFVDSADHEIGDTVAEQRAFGVAHARAILDYYGIKYNGEEDDIQLNDKITNGKVMDGTTYATVGNCIYWAEQNAEKAYKNTVELKTQIAALSAAVEALAQSQGADPDAVAKAVADAVAKKLESISLDVNVA